MNRNVFIFLMMIAALLFSAQRAFCESEPEKAPETMKEQTFRDFQVRTYRKNAAWKFFDKAWVKSVKGKDKFLREFREQLKTSPYWSEIEKMNAR